MKISAEVLARLELEAAAKAREPWSLEHFPRLITDRALRQASSEVTEHTKAWLQAGKPAVYETLSMPKGVTGARPVVYTNIATRIAYNSLVALHADKLDPSSRFQTRRDEFSRFGSKVAEKAYVVLADIASCYEYIVPEILTDEFLKRTDDYGAAEAIHQTLLELSTLGRGIPQMMHVSDRLSDMYLARVDRALERQGLRWVRTADDYKIQCATLGAANKALELLESEVRKIGLILSASKTAIVSSGPSAVRPASGFPLEPDIEEDEDAVDETDSDLARSHLINWWAEWKKARRTGSALPAPPTDQFDNAADSDEILNSKLLLDSVFADPTALEFVTGYIETKKNDLDGADIVRELVGMGRQTAWTKLWLLTAISDLKVSTTDAQIKEFVSACVVDNREAVRAEAAWTLAQQGQLKPSDIQDIHARSTDLTEPGIAAAVAAAGANADTEKGDRTKLAKILKGIEGNARLNEVAAAWGRTGS